MSAAEAKLLLRGRANVFHMEDDAEYLSFFENMLYIGNIEDVINRAEDELGVIGTTSILSSVKVTCKPLSSL
ncbi:hypothetical protein G6F68_013784 [Rhizopus microsporus]|nr:hypothetical protein G6F68_013784 [Rhizopus microsporus]